MKGIIISIEGTDGSGKHTQQQLLSEDLKTLGYVVFDQSFPNYDSPSSEPVKMYLGGQFGNANELDAYQASSLYAIDRMCTYKKTLKEHYENGEIIIFDRYVQSNFIHQCCKINDESERTKFLAWADDFEFNTLKLPRPDLIFFIDMPVEKSLELAHARDSYKNGESKDIHEENTENRVNSYKTGCAIAKKYGWNIIRCMDSNNELKHIEDIHAEIMKKTVAFLKNYTEQN